LFISQQESLFLFLFFFSFALLPVTSPMWKIVPDTTQVLNKFLLNK
jgi:hypothetical protein